MKDFYDIYELSRSCDFDGASLAEAIAKTFKHRNTEFTPNPLVFNNDFPLLPDKQVQWKAFQHRTRIADVPTDFSIVVSAIKGFLLPIYNSLVSGEVYAKKWDAKCRDWVKITV